MTHGTTKAVMFIALARMPMGAILKLVTEQMSCGGEMPPITETDTLCLVRLRLRDCTNFFEIKDVNDPLSRRALVLNDEPSDANIWTWQVFSNEQGSSFVAAMLADTPVSLTVAIG